MIEKEGEDRMGNRCLAVWQMFCGRRRRNLRKIVTKNYSLPAANIPPTITICASRSSMFPEGLKHVCMIQVFNT